MTLKVITPPTQQISTADLKVHLRVTGSDEDAIIAGYLEGAIDPARLYMGRSIGSQTLELALDAFPDAFRLTYGPVTSIVSVMYIDENGFNQTLDVANYALDNQDDVAWLLKSTGSSTWPATSAVANAVRVRYVAGDLPGSVRTALLLMVEALYDGRGGDDLIKSIPGIKFLLGPHKIRLGIA